MYSYTWANEHRQAKKIIIIKWNHIHNNKHWCISIISFEIYYVIINYRLSNGRLWLVSDLFCFVFFFAAEPLSYIAMCLWSFRFSVAYGRHHFNLIWFLYNKQNDLHNVICGWIHQQKTSTRFWYNLHFLF